MRRLSLRVRMATEISILATWDFLKMEILVKIPLKVSVSVGSPLNREMR